MSLEDNLKRRKGERDRKSADRENAQKKWAEAAEKLLIDVQDKLDELVTNGLLTIEAPMNGQLRVTEPGGKTVTFKPSPAPEETIIVLKSENAPHSPHGARALYWDGSRWWILLEANIRSAGGGGIFEHFDFDNRQEYTDERSSSWRLSSLRQPDLWIGRGLPPLKNQQRSGHLPKQSCLDLNSRSAS
jgi:hypothetical protein